MLDIRKIAELPEAHKRDCGKPTGIGGAANRHGKERHMQITGGWVYDPDEGFAERTVCTDGEKITRISTDTKRLDAAGCYVLPLLIDLHIHGYAGADAGSADPAELERMARHCNIRQQSMCISLCRMLCSITRYLICPDRKSVV